MRDIWRWEMPMLGDVINPSAAPFGPDGFVAWVGTGTQVGLADAPDRLVRVPSAE